MREYSTPSWKIKLAYRKTKEPALDYVFDYLILTIDNEGNKIEKRVEFAEVEDATFTVHFTQEETGSLIPGTVYEAELNIMVGEERIPTDIKRFKVLRNLHDEVIFV